MSKTLAIVHGNVPDRQTLINSFKTDIEISSHRDYQTHESLDNLKTKNIDRLALVWMKGHSSLVPFFNHIKVPRVAKSTPTKLTCSQKRSMTAEQRQEYKQQKKTAGQQEKLAKKQQKQLQMQKNVNIEKFGQYVTQDLKNLLVSLKKNNSNFELDLISCNLDATYFDTLEQQLGVKINYSVDLTGNPQHGGDWIAENSGFDFRAQYFTDDITNYKHTLESNQIVVYASDDSTLTITQNFLDTTSDLVAGGYEFVGNTISFGENVSWPHDIYIYLSGNTANADQILIEGNGNSVTFPVSDVFDGLVNIQSSDSSGKTVVIQNVIIYASDSSVSGNNGFFVQQNCMAPSDTLTVSSCVVYGNVNETGAGGFIGSGTPIGDGCTVNINNCTLNGDLDGNDSGGIFGANGLDGNNCTINITGFTINGDMNAGDTGGMFGDGCARGTDCVYTISSCVVVGDINGGDAGGIAGYDFPYQDSNTVTINNCQVTGDVYGEESGGFFGNYCPNGAMCTINMTNCTMDGDINDDYSAGFFGYECPYSSSCVITMTNCTMNGDVNADYSGGFFGYKCFYNDYNTLTVSNSTMNGSIHGDECGGFMGYTSPYNDNNTLTFNNCTMNGNLASDGDYNGGILGYECPYGDDNTIYIMNCTMNGYNMSGDGSGPMVG